jgi:hypothetical protein
MFNLYTVRMEKDFDRWNVRKAILNDNFDIPFYKERDIWFCYLGMNVGCEEDGRRLYYRSRIMSENDFESLRLRLLLSIL